MITFFLNKSFINKNILIISCCFFAKINNKLRLLYLYIMPQLIPFFFFNQILITFVVLFSVVYILSKYVLPVSLLTQVVRTYITKLSNKN
jgi:F-type H+-transporting ATPase subunit 8